MSAVYKMECRRKQHEHVTASTRPILSSRAQRELDYARYASSNRGGFIWEGARPAFEAGTYHDDVLSEMLVCGAIEPHPDPAKGWVVKW